MRQLLAALGLMAALSRSTIALGEPSLAKLNVRVTDLPKGSLQFEDNTMSPAGLTKLTAKPVTVYRQQGIVLENDRSFLISPPGMSGYVFGTIVLLDSVAKARAMFAVDRRQEQSTTFPATPIVLGNLGDERYAVIGENWAGGFVALESFAVVRRGPYVFTCDVIGTTNSFASHEVSRLAAVVNARVKSAL